MNQPMKHNYKKLRQSNMKNLLCFLVLVFELRGILTVFAEPPLPEPYTIYAVSISAGSSQGSGFILQVSNSVYLVTARHVLFNVNQSPTNWPIWGTVATCTGHLPDSSSTVMTLDLTALMQSGDVRYSPNHDVALVRFENCNPTNTTLVTLLSGVSFQTKQTTFMQTPSSLCDRFDDTVVGTDILIFGFPSSIGIAQIPQIDFDLPLLRKGIVAGKNLNRRVYILDCPSYQGNSGGPVIGKEISGNTTRFPVLGVVTEMVPYSESWQNSRLGYVNQNISNSGYSIAEPMDAVLDLVWK
jgi:hypothetical protein